MAANCKPMAYQCRRLVLRRSLRAALCQWRMYLGAGHPTNCAQVPARREDPHRATAGQCSSMQRLARSIDASLAIVSGRRTTTRQRCNGWPSSSAHLISPSCSVAHPNSNEPPHHTFDDLERTIRGNQILPAESRARHEQWISVLVSGDSTRLPVAGETSHSHVYVCLQIGR